MTFTETVEKLLNCSGDENCKYPFLVKFADGSWDCGYCDDPVLSLERRNELIDCKNCELDGYITLTDFHTNELKRLGAEKFKMYYKTALEVAMKSRITMHKKPKS